MRKRWEEFYLIWVVIIYTDARELWSNAVGLFKKLPTVSVRSLSELVGEGDLLNWRRAGQYADVCEQSRVQRVGCRRRDQAQQQASSYPHTQPLRHLRRLCACSANQQRYLLPGVWWQSLLKCMYAAKWVETMYLFNQRGSRTRFKLCTTSWNVPLSFWTGVDFFPGSKPLCRQLFSPSVNIVQL